MAKRALDVVVSAIMLVLFAPLLLLAMLMISAQDGRTPLYLAKRVGRGGRDFRMVKLRSMTADAERRGGTSTSRSDTRLTPIGRAMRRWKLDELPQFWNVLIGHMSIVGPRPNTRCGGVDLYTAEELRLLSVRPGITDISSIVFSDEADILDGAIDADARYDAIIRPWKSRLGLLYVDHHTGLLDLRIMGLTFVAIVAKPIALQEVDRILVGWEAPEMLRRTCRRATPLTRADPPGRVA